MLKKKKKKRNVQRSLQLPPFPPPPPHFFIFETPQRSQRLSFDHLSFDGSSIFLLPSEPGHRLISPRCDRVFGGCERGKRGGVRTRRRRSTLRQAISLSGKRDNQFRASEFRRRRQK